MRDRLMDKAVSLICELAGVPENPLEKIKCVDCGKECMVGECSFTFNMKTCKTTGPHCGCKKGECHE